MIAILSVPALVNFFTMLGIGVTGGYVFAAIIGIVIGAFTRNILVGVLIVLVMFGLLGAFDPLMRAVQQYAGMLNYIG